MGRNSLAPWYIFNHHELSIPINYRYGFTFITTAFVAKEDLPHMRTRLSRVNNYEYAMNISVPHAHGRYMVHLPFKPDHPDLGTSYLPAEVRLKSMERNSSKEPQFQQHVLPVNVRVHWFRSHDKDPHDVPHLYLPRHVLKAAGTSTRLWCDL